LTSVYNQLGIDKSEWCVFVIDDNENESEFSEIKKRIELLRKDLRLNETVFPTTVLKNTRTRFMSGTGAWNTGIFEAYKQLCSALEGWTRVAHVTVTIRKILAFLTGFFVVETQKADAFHFIGYCFGYFLTGY
jgi:hypothetical protein